MNASNKKTLQQPRKTIIATMVSYLINERRYRYQQENKLKGAK